MAHTDARIPHPWVPAFAGMTSGEVGEVGGNPTITVIPAPITVVAAPITVVAAPITVVAAPITVVVAPITVIHAKAGIHTRYRRGSSGTRASGSPPPRG